MEPGFGKIYPLETRGATVIFLPTFFPTEAPGRHSTETRTQASPAMA